MKHIVMFSGGVTSWAAAKRVADIHGIENLTLLFADTLIEDEDTYRFLRQGAENIGVPVTRLCDGRTPWEVFKDEGFIGNSRVDPCSKILKRKLLDKWRDENCVQSDTTIHVGIHWDEQDRLTRLRARVGDWNYQAPLCWEPYIPHSECVAMATRNGLLLPRLYGWGFPHGNCGGFCVKAGQFQFKLLLKHNRPLYLHHEAEEVEAQRVIGTIHTVMRDRRGGTSKPLSMREFRERIESNTADMAAIDADRAAGCACALE